MLSEQEETYESKALLTPHRRPSRLEFLLITFRQMTMLPLGNRVLAV